SSSDFANFTALASLFALLGGLGVVLTTPMSQTNSVAVVLESEFNLQPWIVGVVLAVLTWLVIVRGIKSIGRVAEKLSPIKVGLYLIGGAIVIGANIGQLPAVLRMVFSEAFSTRAAAGGAWGWVMIWAIRYGVV